MGQVFNLQNADPSRGTGQLVLSGNASGSRAGEDNSWHVVAFVGLIGGLILVAGLLNARVNIGVGRE